jgi:hypothetical protein
VFLLFPPGVQTGIKSYAGRVGFPPENGSDVGIAAASILVTGKEPEHLCEIFHVNGVAARNAVELLISPEAHQAENGQHLRWLNWCLLKRLR